MDEKLDYFDLLNKYVDYITCNQKSWHKHMQNTIKYITESSPINKCTNVSDFIPSKFGRTEAIAQTGAIILNIAPPNKTTSIICENDSDVKNMCYVVAKYLKKTNDSLMGVKINDFSNHTMNIEYNNHTLRITSNIENIFDNFVLIDTNQ
jgi:hypothetical protein